MPALESVLCSQASQPLSPKTTKPPCGSTSPSPRQPQGPRAFASRRQIRPSWLVRLQTPLHAAPTVLKRVADRVIPATAVASNGNIAAAPFIRQTVDSEAAGDQPARLPWLPPTTSLLSAAKAQQSRAFQPLKTISQPLPLEQQPHASLSWPADNGRTGLHMGRRMELNTFHKWPYESRSIASRHLGFA